MTAHGTCHVPDGLKLKTPRDSPWTWLSPCATSSLSVSPFASHRALNFRNVYFYTIFHYGQPLPIVKDPKAATCATCRHGRRPRSVMHPGIGPHCHPLCASVPQVVCTPLARPPRWRPPGGARAKSRAPRILVCDKPHPSPCRVHPFGDPGVHRCVSSGSQVVECRDFGKTRPRGVAHVARTRFFPEQRLSPRDGRGMSHIICENKQLCSSSN